jgi:hypothetical protein
MALESQKLFPSAPGTLLLLAMVFTKLQELENIGMPWFQVDCQSSLALTSTWQQLCDQLPQIISMFIAPHPENMPTPWRYDISMFSPQRQRQGPMKFPHGTLIHIPGRLVEVPQHRHQAVAVAVGAADVGATGADVGDGHTNASSLGTFMEFWRKIKGTHRKMSGWMLFLNKKFLAKKLGDLRCINTLCISSSL